MKADFASRAQVFREEAAALRKIADQLDGHATLDERFASVIALEAEKRRALNLALADDDRREGYAFDRRQR